ncbi:hypothetical protein HDU78_005963 [Chytriomyces hyalinus]|nr:hypothetical protein HDU78_005963 [Chytriomyces hyalinus]
MANNNYLEDIYLNIKLKTLPIAKVDVTGIKGLHPLQDAIRATLPNALALVDTPQIQLYDNRNKQITRINDIPEEYYKEICKGGLALTLQTTLPAPRDASSSSLFLDTNTTNPTSTSQCISNHLVCDTTAHFRVFKDATFVDPTRWKSTRNSTSGNVTKKSSNCL